jgi:hypothetical protein
MIDFFRSLTAEEVRTPLPSHLSMGARTRKTGARSVNTPDRAMVCRENWWLFGEAVASKTLRAAIALGLPRYIATVETAKHRTFQFLDADIAPDNMLIASPA